MSISDKLAFWKKKKKEIDLDDPFEDSFNDATTNIKSTNAMANSGVPPLGGPDAPPPPVGPSVTDYNPTPIPSSISHENVMPPPSYNAKISTDDKEFQLINAKLDAIKAALDGVIQRLDKNDQKPKW